MEMMNLGMTWGEFFLGVGALALVALVGLLAYVVFSERETGL